MRWLVVLVILVSSCTRVGARRAMYAGAGGMALGVLIVVGGETEALGQKSSAAPDGRIVLYPIAAACFLLGLALLAGGAINYRYPRAEAPPDVEQVDSIEIMNASASESAEAGDCATVHQIKARLAAIGAPLVMTAAIERCLPTR